MSVAILFTIGEQFPLILVVVLPLLSFFIGKSKNPGVDTALESKSSTYTVNAFGVDDGRSNRSAHVEHTRSLHKSTSGKINVFMWTARDRVEPDEVLPLM